MTIRVIRVMEYEFEDYKEFEQHMANAHVPFAGTKQFGAVTSHTIRSTYLISPVALINEAEGNDDLPSVETTNEPFGL